MSSEHEKKQKKTQVTFSRVFEVFVGNYVEVIIKSIKLRHSDGISSNMAIGGYLLDECDRYFYIGITPHEISSAILKSDVITMNISSEGSSIMDNIEVPDGQEIQ